MGLLSRNLGFWARCAAATVALSALAPAAMAGTPAKTASHHGHGATGKRAVLGEKKVERARTGKNLPAAWTTPARDPKMGAKTVPVAVKDDKASPKDTDKASPKDANKAPQKDSEIGRAHV